MAVPKLSMDQDAYRRIVDLHVNVRERFTSTAAVLNDGVTAIYTAEFVNAAPFGLSLGTIYRAIKDYRDQYVTLGTSFAALYASSYTASAWKTDVDAAVTALNTLIAWIESQATATFTAVNPAATFIVKLLTTPQKQAIATQLLTAIG